MKLPRSFYLREDPLEISKDLLGTYLHTQIDGHHCVSKIVETEAYIAPEDQASHAKNMKKTPRSMTFYKEGGTAYVYTCYGVFQLFNIITNAIEVPHAILIRGVEPIEGIDVMLKRRGMDMVKRNLTAGPGILSIAMGIRKHHNETDLLGDTIWLEKGSRIPEQNIIASQRVGLGTCPEPWKSKPWRFRVKGSKWTSPQKY
ncbi:MAG: DNA-3-methyladenine glycosylase [Saprospiraceae bacterium]|nr:DNA-3-methyladenine glycosylase [Saprospiraceae bacterium]